MTELDRRSFLHIMGASVALAGLDGCTPLPAEHILPYVDNRPELTPTVAQHYATAMSVDGYATGLLVESHEGRPTKIEGNPRHPASLGATSAIHQASVLQLYDPDRGKTCRVGAAGQSWSTFSAQLAPAALRARVGTRGERLRLLLEPTSSPLDEELLARVLQAYPEAHIHMYAPLTPEVGRPAVPHYDFAAADVILAMDADFLASGPFHVRYARQFADKRRLSAPTDAMNRLYVVEPTVTPTGVAADHRFAVRPSEIVPLLRALQSLIDGGGASAPAWLAAIAADLTANRGRSVVVPNQSASGEERALVDAINGAIGAASACTWYAPSALIGQHVSVEPIDALVAALQARAVDTLIIVGGNPTYTTPRSLGVSSLLRAVPNAGYVGLYHNETADDCRWFVPMSHYLESWGDARAYDGTLSIVQPLITPLYETVTSTELYAALADVPEPRTSYDLLRSSWKARGAGGDAAWSEALQRGVVPGIALTTRAQFADTRTPNPDTQSAPAETPSSLELHFATDHKVHDGAYANNAWLQELPAPLTTITWGNAALISPATARRLDVGTGESLTISLDDRRLALPVYVLPGQADEVITVQFGYGRSGEESVARQVGGNAYAVWPAIGVRFAVNPRVGRGGDASPFALAQQESAMAVGDPVRRTTLDAYRHAPNALGDRPRRQLSLYPEPVPPGGQPAANQWAMTIDLATCIGCGSCVVACQAENNIPVVGAEDVRNSRAMQWIRIDRYFADKEVLLQPMLCQQCEQAPCEYVCPVEATVHSDDGLNEMVYNRCVGTRFCSNNCPYKVRHFNWFDYNAHIAETVMMAKNPDVTVRERGVMEKCTFCVQRIREAEIAAERDGRTLRGSDVQTACQQACPTNAIVFGSLSDADSEMMRRRRQPRAYSALGELGTEPRIRYLARIRNANRVLDGEGD